jgi:putative spermidine/putrescine transport system ATP-binding protein
MFIHVTHNQEEALSMADRIVVMNDARIQQVADPLTIATRPTNELVARFMGDNNIISGRVIESANGRVVLENDKNVRVSARADGGPAPTVGSTAQVAVRAAAVEVDAGVDAAAGNSVECEIVFVEFLGDLVKLHLIAGGERMLAKVPGERYPAFRGKEGEGVRISWKEEDVQLLHS